MNLLSRALTAVVLGLMGPGAGDRAGDDRASADMVVYMLWARKRSK
jgi:hypothetical protein